MTGDAEIFDLEIALDEASVRRLLGYRRGRAPRPRMSVRLAALLEEAAPLLRPRGACRIVSAEALAPSGLPSPGAAVGIGLSTIGPALEEAVRACTVDEDLVGAMLLDAIGSQAAEAAADALNQRLCERARAAGAFLAARVSPGYGAWSVEGQPGLLGLLPAAELGVRLTEAHMMLPRKSVSFAARFRAEALPAESSARRCRRCGLLGCAYREEGT